ncbi:hypothetical protein NPX13_g5768 [Xylaria arbuscula]|uniref:ubiquitinyl hydrolase 1 n=1 Tax=Xylaria arbuscula TaxID=114810 RepID=A0A9W8NDU8_9PEZI|nr:hypothetical protein NPX13_g5768 [Xylaria arbuscula]
MTATEVNLAVLGSVFNHLVLPLEVPGVQDSNEDAVSQEIIMRMINATNTALGLSCAAPWEGSYESLRDSLRVCNQLNRGGLERESLLKHFQELNSGRMLILYLNEQNAGLLIHRTVINDRDCVVFESFEASPIASSVLAAGRAMQWDIPGRSTRIDLTTFAEEEFQQNLASFLEKASMEGIYNLQASTRKAGVSVSEVRDTTDPALITQMLMSVLEGVGSFHQAPILRKRIRDDVNLTTGKVPWRRSPLWLILRVASQRQLYFSLGAERGQIAYKYLMAILLEKLLEDATQHLSPHLAVCLRSKLARRMAKLEMSEEKPQLQNDPTYGSWFSAVSSTVKQSIESATTKLEVAWYQLKETTTRPVPKLNGYAPSSSLDLKLNCSGKYLDEILSVKLLQSSSVGSRDLPDPLDQSIKQTQEFMGHAFHLAASEKRIEEEACKFVSPNQNHENRCLELEHQIRDMLSQIEDVSNSVGSAYKDNPEHNSATILAIFTLWVALDRSAIKSCNIIADHAPVFEPELLDSLQLPTKQAMERLQIIQRYLAGRRDKSFLGNILEAPNENSIAVRFVERSESLRSLGQDIQRACNQARQEKKKEHLEMCGIYDEHTEGIANNSCRCNWEDGERVIKNCKKCFHKRLRKRMKIEVHEDFLPKKTTARYAIIFELGIPNWFSAYRNATWQILSALTHPHRPNATNPPALHLHKCRPLKAFGDAEVGLVSLASEIKCFEQTHYKFSDGKVPVEKVLLPFAAAFKLYDSKLKVWVEDLDRPLTLEHKCGVQIPPSLAIVLPQKRHPPTTIDGPSSYEIQANQAQVPQNISIQAFSALQKLLAGKRRRWLNLLVELSSPNLNLSDEETTRVICQLASRAGPRLPDQPLRVVHELFRFTAFTTKMTRILENILESIQVNWREHNTMQLVITLALRLYFLSGQSYGTAVLYKAREYLLQWISQLRQESGKAKTNDDAQSYAKYSLHAALLCRRTFSVFLGSENRLSQEDLSTWLRASMAVQDNLIHDLRRLPDSLRNLLFRDGKMVYHLQDRITGAMNAYKFVVGLEVLRHWNNDILDDEKGSSSWAFLNEPDNHWIVIDTPGQYFVRIHFNYIHGHFLVNGKQRSKLPLEIADDEAVKWIFGDQHLLTYPSPLPGMSHRLVQTREKHQIHFGLRDSRAVIRATRYRQTWEFVPQCRLSKPGKFDLPAELVQNCGHWLNLDTQCLEIRRSSPDMPTFWITRPRDWILNVPKRKATRGLGGSRLVDPYSDAFNEVASIFRNFVEPERLTVFQPLNAAGMLTVELKHLGLHFEVNRNQRLYSNQLNAEIDENQDAGTWYGLSSKIVLRETKTGARSIIVPLGEVTITPTYPHVDVRVRGASHYARFRIDPLLGRLTCSSEPLLIYTKALYHAITSYCLPDKLTGRTGSTEACAILQSGAAQPWEPLSEKESTVLGTFNQLIPRRQYYPPGAKRIQKVIWNPDLTLSIQCDAYRPVIEAIKERSNNLQAFTAKLNLDLTVTSHLCHRSIDQRGAYEPLLNVESNLSDTVYMRRDCQSDARAVRVHEIARVIVSRCSEMQLGGTPMSMFETSRVIGGFSAAVTDSHVACEEPLINQIEDDICENWGELVDFCRRANQFSLLFRLGLLAFNSEEYMDNIKFLAAICLIKDLRVIEPPRHQSFVAFNSRDAPSVGLLEGFISSTYPAFQEQDRWGNIAVRMNKSSIKKHEKACKQKGIELIKRILQFWPTSATDVSEILNSTANEPEGDYIFSSINLESVWDVIRPEWERRLANMELSKYLERVNTFLTKFTASHVRNTTLPGVWVPTEPEIATPKRFPLYRSIIENWVTNPGPELQVVEDIISCFVGKLCGGIPKRQDTISNTSTEIAELSSILSRFERSHNDLREQYASELRESLVAFQKGGRQLDPEIHVNFQRKLGVVYQALQQAQMDAKRIWADISAALLARDARGLWLQLGAMWPFSNITERLVLLRSTECFHFGKGMKSALISYGTALTAVQHLVRIRYALLKKDNRSLRNELRERGHEAWKPTESRASGCCKSNDKSKPREWCPSTQHGKRQVGYDWRIDLSTNDFTGKTSCIIPMTAAFLADGKKLARVVVPKALLIQTAQTMQARLGGLVGRELIQIPYSRRTPTNDNILRLYSKLHHGTLRCRGIMLTCAEHLLSYKLFGWQKYIDSEMSTADQMISFQNWLDTNCRDILDECDFTLSVKTQLNYPSGPEMPVDFHPHRWQLAQELLDLVFTHLPELQRLHTTGVQVTSKRKGRFPVIQFLKVNAENALHDLIREDIFQGRLSLLRYFQPRSGPEQSDLREVLCEVKISEDVLSRASNLFDNPTIATNALLLLRGLILHRTLILCLGKRWNVQYGMHPDRDPIAVPFEAKGKPSDQAEYGHPDVAIIFTCLSFYYGGLTQAQLVQGVQHLLQSSDPATQYEWLISTCEDVPASLKQWNTINADDKGQMEGLWQLLRWNRVAINYYLNHFVFPIHARQFEVKLQANAWDIPIFSKDNTQVTRTSGFSGTNDNRWVLPLTINQRDLPGLKHTSAEVISYLLQERNRQFIVIPRPRLKESKEEGFLRDLKRENITVLIDVGAYISEMDNQEVARAWLEVDSEAKAVIYFRNDNRAWVHYRGNLKEDLPLLATELADDLSGCNVFLDEGHTRGVDLRLPANARGAVTLALKQTKDHTIQAAMRLRQLQTTQSLCFYGPPEVQSSIKDFCHLKNRDTIDSSHVVSWLLEQTCLCIEDLRGLYVSQGIDFCQRTDTIWRCKNFLNDESEREKLLRVLKQPERKTLKESYGPVPRISTTSIGDKLATTQLNSFMDRLALTGKNLEGRIEAGALEEVEQEREVESQVEHIRQVEKRKIYDASKFPGVNPDIMSFAETGVLEKSKRKPPGFQHAFSFVGKMAIGKRFSVHGTSSRLFVSWEFANTVKLPQHSKEADNFLRPVEWIVWSPETTTALIVIPEEAEWLLEYLRDKETVSHVHVIAYSAPVTASMIKFNNLDFYTSPTLPTGHIIPMQIRIELGILAGRLYVKEDEWVAVAEYVRGTSNDADKIAPDPASFLLEWLTIRRKTANIMHTHMGCICTGREMDHPDPSEVVEED